MDNDMYFPSIDFDIESKALMFKEFGKSSLNTGMEDLDSACIFAPGVFTVVGGAPGMGKHAFMYSLIRSHLRNEISVAYVTRQNLNHPVAWARLLTSVLKDQPKLSSTYQCWEYVSLVKPVEIPMHVLSTPLLTLEKIRNTTRTLVKEQGVKVIYLDSIQSVALAEEDMSARNIKKVCLELKALAYELQVPIVITCDIDSRRIERRYGIDGKRPNRNDLKGGKFIKDIADVILLIYRPEYYHIYENLNGTDLKGSVLLIIDKDEFGLTCDIPMRMAEGVIFRYNSEDDPERKITMSDEEARAFLESSDVMKEFADKFQLEVSKASPF